MNMHIMRCLIVQQKKMLAIKYMLNLQFFSPNFLQILLTMDEQFLDVCWLTVGTLHVISFFHIALKTSGILAIFLTAATVLVYFNTMLYIFPLLHLSTAYYDVLYLQLLWSSAVHSHFSVSSFYISHLLTFFKTFWLNNCSLCFITVVYWYSVCCGSHTQAGGRGGSKSVHERERENE